MVDRLKDPATLLSVVDAIGLVGATYYFYKQNESLRADMQKMSQSIGAMVKKLGELEKTSQQNVEAVRVLNEQIKPINEQMKQFSDTITDMSGMEEDLEMITATLEKHNIPIEDTKPPIQYKGKDFSYSAGQGHREIEQDRRVRKRDTDYERSGRPKNRTQAEFVPMGTRANTNRPEQPYSYNPSRSHAGLTYPSESITSHAKIPEFSDDSDIIADVRRQQDAA